MPVTYKDISLLTQKASVAGTEKIPVSDTEFITPTQIAGKVPVDSALSSSSPNAIQNQAVEAEFEKVLYLGEDDGTADMGVYTPEDSANKVTSLSSSSTDVQYPSAKCVYDLIGDVETLLAAL